MAKANVLKRLSSINKLITYALILGSIVSIFTFSNVYSLKSFLNFDSTCNHGHDAFTASRANDHEIKETLDLVINKLEKELDAMRISTHETPQHSKHASLLADVLSLVELARDSLSLHPENPNKGQEVPHPDRYFLKEELNKYMKVKPNRLGKQNFMGANGTHTSIGHGCFASRDELESYMDYDVGDICNDDWKLAQRLMIHGCDPLPRRRCYSRAPHIYTRPRPINESLWKLPDDRNVRWSGYRCKNFTCLASNTTKKGFFKCAECFNLLDHELPRWIRPSYIIPNSNLTSDFTIAEVLDLKRDEIRIGLDFSVGTGTFAARMKEQNVSIVTATINLGAPFSEMIALRGLIPLYVTVNQRLPFFDNTLDLIHTTRFLDGWIDLVLLEFVLYDWDRVLRPGGILWIDSFFCVKEDLGDYLEVFKMLRYKKHKWIVVPKFDKNDDREVFFSALLEKPSRPF